MKQIIVRKMTLSDYLLNSFYKFRFWFYRNFNKSVFKDRSEPMKKKKEIVFKDNFDRETWGTKQDGLNWTVGGHASYHPGNLSQYYGPPKLVRINNKIYTEFTVKHQSRTFASGHWPNTTTHDIDIPYEVSRLSSIDSFRQNHGRFECRCTIPHDRAVWPAFWMWGSTWPPEIDVFEFYGGKDGKKAGIQEINLHYGLEKEGNKEMMGAWGVKIERKQPKELKFHEFACEWSKDKIEVFTDGIKIFRYTRKDVLDKWFNTEVAEMWVVINHAFQHEFLAKDDRSFKSSFFVDYVRVYKNKA